jgi:hypothetical protein
LPSGSWLSFFLIPPSPFHICISRRPALNSLHGDITTRCRHADRHRGPAAWHDPALPGALTAKCYLNQNFGDMHASPYDS